MISSIIMIISLILDGLLTNYLPYMISDLSIFTPLFSVTALILIYPFFYKEKRKYLIYSFIYGVIYDLFYTNLLFLNGLFFVLLAVIISNIYQLFGTGYIKILLSITLIIIIYELLYVIVIVSFNLVPITINKIIYKISHSILLNLIYGEFTYIILRLIPKKYLKINLN